MTKKLVGRDDTKSAGQQFSPAVRTEIGLLIAAAAAPLSHTHTASQISDFTEAAQDAINALLVGASGVSLSYNDAANTLTITGGGSGGLDAEAVRDAIGVAIIGAGGISVVVNDAADTITITTTAYIPGGTDVAVADGGTGSSSAAGARNNLGILEAQRADLASATARRLGAVVSKLAYGFLGLSDGSIKGQTARTWHDVGETCTGVRFVYANFHGADVANPSPIYVKSSAETVPAGIPTDSGTIITPIYFDGQRTVTIPPGGVVISDVVPITVIKGQGVYDRTYVSVNKLGQGWPIGKFNDNGSVGGGATLDRITSIDVDNTDTADPTVIGNTWLRPYGPVAILSVTATRSLGLAGDSIFAGEAVSAAYGDSRKGGWGQRAFAGKAGVINIALPSEASYSFIAAGLKYRAQMLRFCTDVLCEYGNGDVHQSSPTTAAAMAYLQKIWALFASYGVRVHVATISPRTTSTDNWVTTGNQTLNAQHAVRIAVNDWIRAGAPQDVNGVAVTPGTGGAVVNPFIATVSDVADAVETTRNSGIWKANYTGDGVHPNPTASAAMADAVPTDTILATNTVVATGGVVPPANNPLYGPGVTSRARAVLANPNANTPNQFAPSDHGFATWAYDIIHAGGSLVLPLGTVTLIRLKIDEAQLLSNLFVEVATAGAGLTAGQNLAALFQNGNLLSLTADQSTAWATVGFKTMALTTPSWVDAGVVDLALLPNGTTSPAFTRQSSKPSNYAGPPGFINGNNSRWAVADTGRTTMPTTLGARSVAAISTWGAAA